MKDTSRSSKQRLSSRSFDQRCVFLAVNAVAQRWRYDCLTQRLWSLCTERDTSSKYFQSGRHVDISVPQHTCSNCHSPLIEDEHVTRRLLDHDPKKEVMPTVVDSGRTNRNRKAALLLPRYYLVHSACSVQLLGGDACSLSRHALEC